MSDASNFPRVSRAEREYAGPRFAHRTASVEVQLRVATQDEALSLYSLDEFVADSRQDFDSEDPGALWPSPTWWLVDLACNHDEEDCRCGPSALSEVIGELPGEARKAALDAHLDMVEDLGAHCDEAWAIAYAVDQPDELPGTPRCVGCLLDPGTHAAELESELVVHMRDFADTATSWGFRFSG